MWNETAMHQRLEDGRGQCGAWSLPLILFAGMVAGSLLTGGAEHVDRGWRSPAQPVATDLAR